MSDHEELADKRDEQADAMEQESDRVEQGVDEAKNALDAANSQQSIPHAMGEDDPGYRDEEGNKPGLDDDSEDDD